MSAWTAAAVPELPGQRVIITGANSGIGFEAARVLAARQADVILGVRDRRRGEAAVEALRRESAQSHVEAIPLDLADLASVRHFAATCLERSDQLSLLINNAGVMAAPYRRTVDGFELHLGTNHLGHFALTGLLLPALLRTERSRVVTVSSNMHTRGRMAFDNLDGSQGYGRWSAYSQSKLANLLFAYELQRRLSAARAPTISVACHPGWAATNLQTAGFKLDASSLNIRLMQLGNRLAQTAAQGALPTLFAATSPTLRGGEYVGPGGRFHRGPPAVGASSARSHDRAAAERLWRVSADLTDVRYAELETTAPSITAPTG